MPPSWFSHAKRSLWILSLSLHTFPFPPSRPLRPIYVSSPSPIPWWRVILMYVPCPSSRIPLRPSKLWEERECVFSNQYLYGSKMHESKWFQMERKWITGTLTLTRIITQILAYPSSTCVFTSTLFEVFFCCLFVCFLFFVFIIIIIIIIIIISSLAHEYTKYRSPFRLLHFFSDCVRFWYQMKAHYYYPW